MRFESLSKSGMGRFLMQTGTYGMGTAATPVLAALLIPVYARVLTTAEFGELAIILTVQAFLEMVVGLRLNDAIVRVYYNFPASERHDVLSTCLVAVGVSSAVFTGTLLLLGHYTSVAAIIGIKQSALFDLLIIAVAFSVVRNVVMGGLRAQQRAKTFVFVALGGTTVTLVAKVLFVAVLRQGVIGAMRGAVAGELFALLLGLSFILFRHHRWGWSFSRDMLRACLRFGLPLVPSGFFNWVKEAAPRYFLLWFGSEVAVGQLSLAKALVGPVSTLALEPIRQAWAPMIYAVRDEERQRSLVSEGLYGIVALLCWVGLGMCAFRTEIVHVVLSTRHAGVADLLPLFVLAVVIREIVMPLGIGINIKSRTELHSLGFFVSAAVMVGLNMVLVPRFGVWGAATAIVLSSVSLLTVYGIGVKRVFPLESSCLKLAGIGLIGIVFWIASELLRAAPGWISIISRCFLCGLFPVVLYVGGFLGSIGVRAKTAFKNLVGMSGVTR